MSSGQVAGRYAGAWLEAAESKKAYDSVVADCNALQAMLANDDFCAFLASPLVSKTDQEKTVAALALKAKLHNVSVSMLRVLVENGRLNTLSATLKAAKDMIDARAGETRAEVTSAQTLDDKKITDIRAQIAKKLGKDVSIETKIDPSIVGGLVIKVGSTMIDDSVKTKLERLQRRLLSGAAA